MSGWLISVQKPSTGEMKTVAVSIADQAAALHAVSRACVGLPATLAPLKPADDQLLEFHGVPAGGLRLV
jgi:hypothetical protein